MDDHGHGDMHRPAPHPALAALAALAAVLALLLSACPAAAQPTSCAPSGVKPSARSGERERRLRSGTSTRRS